jgi:hypothetical protein
MKALRKGMREIKEYSFPYRVEYHYGFHNAVEICNKLIEQEIRKYQKAKKKYIKTVHINKFTEYRK